jgi:hypothetical protein
MELMAGSESRIGEKTSNSVMVFNVRGLNRVVTEKGNTCAQKQPAPGPDSVDINNMTTLSFLHFIQRTFQGMVVYFIQFTDYTDSQTDALQLLTQARLPNPMYFSSMLLLRPNQPAPDSKQENLGSFALLYL